MRLLRSALLVLAVFVGVGLLIDRLVLRHAAHRGTPPSQVRLAAAMAGLFAGGAVGSMTTLALAFRRRT